MNNSIISIIICLMIPLGSWSQCNQFTFLIDNSGSIQPMEWEEYAKIIDNTIDNVDLNCSDEEIAVINYGGEFGSEFRIVNDFIAPNIIPDLVRSFPNNSGDNLNETIGNLNTSLQNGFLSNDPSCQHTLVIFTDSAGGECDGSPGQSCLTPNINIEIGKAIYYDHVFVVGIEADDNEAELQDYLHGDGSYIPIAFEDDNQQTAAIISSELSKSCNHCIDISSSLIPNPDFEETTCNPTMPESLNCAIDWLQATDATSDFFSTITYPNLIAANGTLYELNNPPPPNGSEHYVGSYQLPTQGDYNEYVGGCLSSPIVGNTEFTLVLDLGAPSLEIGTNGVTYAPEVLIGEIVVLGIPNCSLPISGTDCKEDNYEIIGRQAINIQGGTWQQGVEITINASQDYPAIMFGLGCNTGITENTYLLSDNILVIEGENPCSDTDPCNDLSTSLIPNPDFEELANIGIEPTDNSQLSRAKDWEQATNATSDYFSLVNNSYPNRPNNNELLLMPPSINPDSERWVGGWRIPNSTRTSPEEYIEYIGTELLSPLVKDELYTLKMNIGAPRTETDQLPSRLIGDIVVLGLPDNTSFPISGEDCKQDNGYEEIGRVSIDLPEFSWQEVIVELNADQQDYNFIMFGLSCDTDPYHELIYFLADDLFLIRGEDPCPQSTICDDNTVLNFTDQNEIVTLDGIGATENFTIGTWFKADATDNGGAEDRIFSFGQIDRLEIGLDQAGFLWRFDQNHTGTDLQSHPNFIRDGEWHHVAFIADGNTRSLYLDFELVETYAASNIMYGPNLTIGNWPGDLSANANFTGSLDEFRGYDIAVDKTQLCELFTEVPAVVDDNLRIYFDFEDGAIAGGERNRLTRNKGDLEDGELINFSLTGNSSNFICEPIAMPSCSANCFTIQAENPSCNSTLDTDSNNSYTLDFTFTNRMDSTTFDKLLILDSDNNFSLDIGGTLIDLPESLAPGESMDLSWGIDALGTFDEETMLYCFDIAPYNAEGPCCKDTYCIELESCCDSTEEPICMVSETDVSVGESDCCYEFSYSYSDCLAESFTHIQAKLLTEELTLVSEAFDGFTLNQQSNTTISIANEQGTTLPASEGISAFMICIDNLISNSPPTQTVQIDWLNQEGDTEELIFSSTKELNCNPPEDTCTNLSEGRVYCGDDGLYHYEFRITNVSDRQKDASIIVLDNGGNPGDFIPQTFPSFPDHTPNGIAYLPFGETTELLDIALPNASLGTSYEFFISLHDYRNIDPEDGDYWCCFTPDSITIEIEIPCDEENLFADPLSHISYPNPVDNELNIEFNQTLQSETQLLIQGIGGATVNQELLREGAKAHKLNTGNLTPGIYFLKFVDTDGRIKHSMFVKE